MLLAQSNFCHPAFQTSRSWMAGKTHTNKSAISDTIEFRS